MAGLWLRSAKRTVAIALPSESSFRALTSEASYPDQIYPVSLFMLHSSEDHPPPPQQDTTNTTFAAAYDMSVDNQGPDEVEKQTRTSPRFNIQFRSPKLPLETGYMNTAYLTTLSGYFKIGESVLSFIAFICAVSTCRSSHATWTEYTTWTNCIIPLVFIFLYVVFPHISNEENTKQGLVFTELLYYATGTLFNFISFCLMASVASYKHSELGISLCQPNAAAVISCVFCLVLTVLFAVDTFFKFVALRRAAESNEPPPPQNGAAHP